VRALYAQRIANWGALPEFTMQQARLLRFLEIVSPVSAVRLIEELLIKVRYKDHAAVRLYLALLTALEIDADMRARVPQWRAVASAQGYEEVVVFLSDPPPLRGLQEDDNSESKLPPDVAALTLGEKKARARRVGQRGFAVFYDERHPDVLKILLANPALCEDEVVRWAARRPLSEAWIQAVCTVPRWLLMRDVVRAIVLNPTAPPRVVVRLMPLVRLQDLRELRRGMQIHPAVSGHAERLIRLRDYADFVDSADSDAVSRV